MSNLKVFRGGREWKFKSFLFPSGEVGVKLESPFNQYPTKSLILARLNTSTDIIELIMLVDAIRRIDKSPIDLFLPKIPYAQQDRVCDYGESLSVAVFANIINSLNFAKVTVIDPHSNVSEALINNIEVITQLSIIKNFNQLWDVFKNSVLVAPDSGSVKKTYEIARLAKSNFIRADKIRDLTNGSIKETIVYCDDLKGQNVVICDDIALGGRTFTELAKVLKSKGAGEITLFVTHGVFSSGLDCLYNGGIDKIFTTDSFRTDLVKTDKLKVFKIEKSYPSYFSLDPLN